MAYFTVLNMQPTTELGARMLYHADSGQNRYARNIVLPATCETVAGRRNIFPNKIVHTMGA